ncbi:MAG: GNAT family N-acyltransferase [Pseudomonadota bacterium]
MARDGLDQNRPAETLAEEEGAKAPSKAAGRTVGLSAARRAMASILPFGKSAQSEPALLRAPLPGTPLYDASTASSVNLGDSLSLGSIGSLEVRLATDINDIRRAQRLRYDVFYREMSAKPSAMHRVLRRDYDRYDPVCDHLLVLDHDAPRDSTTGAPAIVGTYRLLTQDVASENGGFYSAGEYQIDTLVNARPDLTFLELGRSCVLKPYRTKRTVELLWHGIWSYVVTRKIDVLFGCASLDGTDPNALALPLSFLHHFASADADWSVRALTERYEPMNRMDKGAIDQKEALRSLPPLIKGYLRLGGMIGDGAVVDHQFGTTDVLILLPVEKISKRYISYYGADASRRAN